MNVPLSTERLTLEQMRVGASTAVGDRALLHVEENLSDIVGGLMVRLESMVLAERLVGDAVTGSATVAFPSTPWQFFKERHAEAWWLGWLVRRHPVTRATQLVQTRGRVERHATYPVPASRSPNWASRYSLRGWCGNDPRISDAEIHAALRQALLHRSPHVRARCAVRAEDPGAPRHRPLHRHHRGGVRHLSLLVEHIAAGRKSAVYLATARALDDYYALNHMNPLDDTPARRAKTHAKRLGFLPPLAWDNIEAGI